MRATLLVLLALLVAGCLEGAEDPAPGTSTTPTAGSPTPSSTPTPPPSTTPATPSPPADDANASVQTVAAGWSSGHHAPYRRVITWDHGWNDFWATHSRDRTPPEPQPAVDFNQTRLVAVALGDKPNSCWAVRISDYRVEGNASSVLVTTYTPPPDRMCAAVISQPYHVVSIPLGPEVSFREETRVGLPE